MHLHQVVALDLLRGIRERGGLADDTHGRHDGLAEHVVFFKEHDFQFGNAVPYDGLRLVADEAHLHLGAFLHALEREVSIVIDVRAVRSAYNGHACTRQCHSFCIHDGSFQRRGLLHYIKVVSVGRLGRKRSAGERQCAHQQGNVGCLLQHRELICFS